jgi:hypothetical protein
MSASVVESLVSGEFAVDVDVAVAIEDVQAERNTDVKIKQ